MSKISLSMAMEYHHRMPGIIRATLNDNGLSDLNIDCALLGWDGRRVTRPLVDQNGQVIDIERYDLRSPEALQRLIKELTWARS